MMKMKTIYRMVLCAVGYFFCNNISAQKLLNEVVLKYNISIETINGEKPVASALNGAVLTIYLTKDKSRSEMVSAPGVETNVYDSKLNKGFILKEYSSQKLMITLTGENWNQKNHLNKNLNFETENSTTTIAGYTCKKGVAQTADGKKYVVYYDPSTIVANKTYNNAFPQINGLPVQYEISSGNLIFRYRLSQNNLESIPINKFDAPKSQFRVMSYEENQQLKKGE